MASSDSTGFHSIGWKFHQFSSSGQILEATSDDTFEGVMNLGTGGVQREQKQTVLDSSSGALLEGFNVMVLTSDPAYATLPLNPAVGSKVRVVIQGNSSNLYRITVSSSGNTINGSTAQYGVAGDSDTRCLLGLGIVFEATGTASYRLSRDPSSALGVSTALL